MADDLRSRFTVALKEAMLAKDAPRTSTVRMILAKLKDADIAARPTGMDKVPDEEVVGMLRSMVKSRRESVNLYRQGGRPELVAKEEGEIAIIEAFLPRQMDEPALASAVDAAIAGTGATDLKDMGKVMSALKARHGAVLDMARANLLVKSRLG